MQGTASARNFHILCCFGYTAVSLAWTVWAGRDQSWDQINYHIYVALAWWQDRLPGELFAASAQGYLNPLPHLPFFAAFSTGWPSLSIALVIAALHSTNLWLLHFIAATLIPAADRLHRTILCCGVLLGGLTPAFLIETGTSFADVIVSIPSLAAMLCLMHWHRSGERRSWGLLWLAGILAGIATGLKPSALVFSMASALAAVLTAGAGLTLATTWRAVTAGFGGLILAGGPHALMLWQAFGNPVFPLFNGVFHSPWFIDANVVSDRFRPGSLTDALRYPLDLANAFKRVGFERIAVDIRPASLIILLLVLAVVTIFTRHPRHWCGRPKNREAWLFWTSLAIFAPAWLYTSGNTRYAVQALMLLGPAIASIALRLQSSTAVVPMLAIGLPLAIQGTVAFTLNAPRWTPRAWTASPADITIPAKLRDTPAYYLSLQTQTYSMLSAFLPAASRFANPVGQNTLDPDGLVWKAIRADIDTRNLPLRSLVAVPTLIEPSGVPTTSLDEQDALLSEYGLRTVRDDCQWIVFDGAGTPPLRWTTPKAGAKTVTEMDRSVLVSCALEAIPKMAPEESARRRAVDTRMDRWALDCPAQFAPLRTYSQQQTRQRQRIYVNTDSLILEANEQLSAYFINDHRLVPLEDEQGHHLIQGCPNPSIPTIGAGHRQSSSPDAP